jgi:hypothetical protein
MVKTGRGEMMRPSAHQGGVLGEAMREVHQKVPKNVVKTGKTGEAKEKMLQAIAFSKARKAKSGVGTKAGHKKTGKMEWVG